MLDIDKIYNIRTAVTYDNRPSIQKLYDEYSGVSNDNKSWEDYMLF
jgi:hypothetical protein